jgi:Tol biopolymer transport system component
LASSDTIDLHVLTNVCSEDRISGRDVAVSGDGRYAAFLQVCRSDWQLVREDLFTGERREIAHFAMSLQRNTNTAPQLNYDGSQIVYHDFGNVYLYSAVSNTIELISVNSAKTGPGNRPSFQGVLSPDGRYVLFASLATDLITPTTPATFNLFLRDLKNKTTRLVSTTDFEYSGYGGDGAFSANAQHIVFTTAGARRAMLYGISNQVRRTVCDNCESPNLNADGRWVAYETRDAVRQVMLRDMQTGVTNLVSKDVSGTGGGNANSTGPLITSDGRFVIFVSRATNLVAEPMGGEPNIFVYGRVQNVTWLA